MGIPAVHLPYWGRAGTFDRAAIKLLYPLRIIGTPSIGVSLENLKNGHGTRRNLPGYPGVIHDGWDFAQRFDRCQPLGKAPQPAPDPRAGYP